MINHTDKEIENIKELLSVEFKCDLMQDFDASLKLLINDTQVEDFEVFQKIKNILTPYGYQVFLDGYVTIYSSRVVELFSLSENGAYFIIETDEDEVKLQSLLGSDKSLEVLSKEYHNLTGKEVIDHRCDRDHEYTNVDAQDDPDFWSEELINDINYRVQ